MANPLLLENVWLHQQKFEDAERLYKQIQAGVSSASPAESQGCSLADELAQVRQDIQNVLNKPPVKAGAGAAGGDNSVYKRLDALEKENRELKKITDELRSMILNIQSGGSCAASTKPAAAPAKPAAPAAKDDDDDEDDDDDIDLFGDDDEEEEAARAALKERRVKEYAERKAKKPAVIAKSNVVLDVKPWDDETDMKVVETNVRKIEMDGLLWGAGKLVEVGYGIKKLVISCVVEDDKVSIEDLSDLICQDEDYVQSVDIAAFNKV